MKRLTWMVGALFLCGGALGLAKTPPKPANFSGTWILDASQTKGAPAGLESYRMVVLQKPDEIKVSTALKGDVKEDAAAVNPNGPLGPNEPSQPRGSGYPNGSIGGIYGRGGMGGMGGIGMGRPGGETPMGEGLPGGGLPGSSRGSQPGGSTRQGRSRSTAGAFIFYPKSAVFHPDGAATSAQFGGPMRADATLKADWAKNGQELKMSLNGNQYSSSGGGSLEMKDQWKLSKDGKSLMVDRSVHAGRSSTTVHLVFHREAEDTGAS